MQDAFSRERRNTVHRDTGRAVLPEGDAPAPRDGYDVLVLGAGASGLACAARCVELGLSVCVLDRAREPGRKLAMAGGGRANFTNAEMHPGCFRCGGGEGFVAPVLEAFGTEEMVGFIRGLHLPCEKRPNGKYFLTCEARELTRALLARCRRGVFTLRMEESFDASSLQRVPDGFRVKTRGGGAYAARRLVVALGSPAWPACGASGLGYAVAQALGHGIVPPQAALVPLHLPQDSPLVGLQGVSVPVTVSVGTHSVTDDMLFTHDGVSGPAILKATLYWNAGEDVVLDFLAGVSAADLLADAHAGRGTPRSILSRRLPQNLVDALLSELLPQDLRERRAAELSKKVRASIAELINAYRIPAPTSAGLRKAEVCRGGVDVAKVEPMSFASRRVPGVHLVGEVLDVTGLLGGYNLHWAFASGMLAAQAMARELRRRHAENAARPDGLSGL